MTKTPLFLLLMLFLCAQPLIAADIGSPALPITAQKWLNGSAVDPSHPDGKTVYVIDFWATTCLPCRRSLPIFADIHTTFSTQSVVVVGVTTDSEENLKAYLAKHPIPYRLAIDTNATTPLAYIGPDFSIPHAFIIDTNGLIAWSGNPLDGLEEALALVLSGQPAPDSITGTDEQSLAELQQLVMAGDLDAAIEKVDGLITSHPREPDYYQMKLGLLAQADRTAEFKKVYVAMLAAFQDAPDNLNMLAWIASTSPPEACDLAIAWEAITKASLLTQGTDSSVLDTLARLYFSAGFLEKALATEKKALAQCEDPREKGSIRTAMDFYESALRLRNTIEDQEKPQEITP